MNYNYENFLKTKFLRACQLDVFVEKPGNVSIRSPGYQMTAKHFLDSAIASIPAIFDSKLSMGEKIFWSVRRSFSVAGCNTNLGIILLCVPVIHALQGIGGCGLQNKKNIFECLHKELKRLIINMGVEESDYIYKAIAFANPGGLGESGKYDVRGAKNYIYDAMQYAKKKDFIAKQYTNGFADLLRQPILKSMFTRITNHQKKNNNKIISWESMTLSTYLYWLTTVEDSHIKRKHGLKTAEEISKLARKILSTQINFQNTFIKAKNGRIRKTSEKRLREFDLFLKKKGFNPGTSADLTVCTLFLLGLLEPDYSAKKAMLAGRPFWVKRQVFLKTFLWRNSNGKN